MSDELKQLMEQKKDLEQKIRELRSQSVRIGDAKIAIEHYPTSKPDRHYLALLYRPLDGRCKWVSIFSANDHKSVVDAIPGIIDDLTRLYEKENT